MEKSDPLILQNRLQLREGFHRRNIVQTIQILCQKSQLCSQLLPCTFVVIKQIRYRSAKTSAKHPIQTRIILKIQIKYLMLPCKKLSEHQGKGCLQAPGNRCITADQPALFSMTDHSRRGAFLPHCQFLHHLQNHTGGLVLTDGVYLSAQIFPALIQDKDSFLIRPLCSLFVLFLRNDKKRSISIALSFFASLQFFCRCIQLHLARKRKMPLQILHQPFSVTGFAVTNDHPFGILLIRHLYHSCSV